MNILFVTPRPPFPPSDGARLVVANLAQALGGQHDLFCVCLGDGKPADERNTQYFKRFQMVPQQFVPRWRKWTHSLVDSVPLWIRAHESNALRAALIELVCNSNVEVAHFDTGLMAQYGDALPNITRVLGAHDSLTHAAEQLQARAPRRSERLAARSQLEKLRQYEARAYASFARVITVTESERAILQNINPALRLSVIPNGVDTDFFAPAQESPVPHTIGFLGVMSYVPNIAAALFFANELLPRVWGEIPDATFTIIGRDPAPALLELTRDARIRVTGEVEDVRPFIAAQSIIVCPMRDAGGIKNKMLEAMAMGKAIVATPEAADGMDARSGTEFLQARGAAEFANACVKLLRDADLRAQLGERARAWALQHTWQVTAQNYLDVYAATIKEGR